MKKIVPAIFGILIVLIIWVYFTNNIISPQSNIPTSTTSKNATIKTSPIKNEDGSLTYNNINSNVYISMKRILLRAGFKVPNGNEGDIYIYGTKIHSKWDNVTNLTITIKDKPWYIPCGLITDKITDFVNKCGGS